MESSLVTSDTSGGSLAIFSLTTASLEAEFSRSCRACINSSGSGGSPEPGDPPCLGDKVNVSTSGLGLSLAFAASNGASNKSSISAISCDFRLSAAVAAVAPLPDDILLRFGDTASDCG